MGWIEIVSLIVNFVLGGTVWVQFATLKSIKHQAAANAEKANANAKEAHAVAKSSELDNVNAAIKIWREMAEEMASERADLSQRVENLSVEVRRLKNATNRVTRLLDRITPDNMSEMLEEIKKEINNEATIDSDSLISSLRRVQDSPPNCRSPN